MKYTILCVGKIKEKYWNDAISEYTKRLSRYGTTSIVQVDDEKTPDRPTDREREQILTIEASRLCKHLDEHGYLITLEINGEKFTSEGLSQKIEQIKSGGYSHIQFVIGGSLGLSNVITQKADLHMSFSDLTFPHQMMRVILLEQIYRSCRIANNEPYHK